MRSNCHATLPGVPLYEALGPEKSMAAFAAPGGKLDETHHAAFGAYELAKCVAAVARTQRLGFRHLSLRGKESSRREVVFRRGNATTQ